MKLDLPIKAAGHTDAVTHEHSIVLRKAHNHQTSQRLKKFQKCVKDKRTGQRASGATASARALMAREQQAAAAKACAGGRG